MQIRQREPGDERQVAEFLAERHSARVARRGALLEPRDHPAVVAVEGSRVLGVLTYVIDGGQCEVLTLHTLDQWRGTGSALLAEVERIAAQQGCTRLWLITTNDNVDALRFYQRRGFRLAALLRGAVDDSRARLKPEIPAVGAYDIPLRDEIELDKSL